MTRTRFLLGAALGLLTIITSPAVAQAPANAPKVRPERAQKSPDEKAAAMTQRMTTQLTLTPEQQTRVGALNTQLAADLTAIRAARAADKAARGPQRAKAQEVRANYETSLKTVLTPDQYTLHEKQRAEQTQKMKARHAARHGAHGAKGHRSATPAQPTDLALPQK